MLITSYPVYVIKVGSGYAIMATPDSPEEKPEYAVLVFRKEELADQFIEAVGLESADVRYLRDERELGRVLASQPAEVTHIAIDSSLKDGHLETTCLTLYEMIKNHMPLARSPWDYPVFFLRQKNGSYSAVQTEKSLVIAMFTSNQLAKDYRSKLDHPAQYELTRIETPKTLLEFLKALPETITAVAFNPTMDGQSTKAQCLEITKLIEKFLS
ncbi:MAG: hypothetical protein IJU53_00900 [Thermoguttaceae bacterium]|nr:hypothetical protein [Thermoguttaceae bacterium]